MTDFLGYIAILGLTVQALIGLAFLISSLWEKEKRASIFAGIQFSGMLGLLILFIFWQASLYGQIIGGVIGVKVAARKGGVFDHGSYL